MDRVNTSIGAFDRTSERSLDKSRFSGSRIRMNAVRSIEELYLFSSAAIWSLSSSTGVYLRLDYLRSYYVREGW